MSHKCGHHSCSHEEHGHSHEEGTCSCSCHHHHVCEHEGHHGKFSDQLLNLADEAWMEVLKEKVKEHILHHSGDHLNQMAQLIAQTNHKRWMEIMSEKKNEQEFEERLKEFLHRQK